MTLIAGFKVGGHEFLIGDMLLSRMGTESGSSKKIQIISKNFCIGWSGNKLYADILLNDIIKVFENKKVNFSELRDFLTNYPTSDFFNLELFLVGWVISSNSICFSWNSEWSHEVFENDFCSGGSGAKYFDDEFMKLELMNKNDTRGIKDSIHYVRSWIYSHLMADELRGETNKTINKFGKFYDVIVYTKKGFKYADDLTFLCVDYIGNKKRIEIEPTIYKYLTHGNYSIYLKWNINDNKIHANILTPTGNKNRDTVNYLVNKYKDKNNINFNSKNYVLFCTFWKNNKHQFVRLVYESKANNCPIKISGINKLQATSGWFDTIFKLIEQDNGFIDKCTPSPS